MNKNPRIKISLSRLDFYLEVFVVCGVIYWWIYTIISYDELPKTIPIHYNFKGEVDGYGHKATLFLVPFIMTMVILLLTYISRIPHLFNYPAKITEQNAEYQYRLVTKLLRFLKLIITTLGIYITATIVTSAKSGTSSMNALLIPVLLFAISVPTGIYLWKSLTQQN